MKKGKGGAKGRAGGSMDYYMPCINREKHCFSITAGGPQGKLEVDKHQRSQNRKKLAKSAPFLSSVEKLGSGTSRHSTHASGTASKGQKGVEKCSKRGGVGGRRVGLGISMSVTR